MYTYLTLTPFPLCASPLPRPNPAAGRTKAAAFCIDEAATYPRYERDAKYYQPRMVATEVGFGATFSAATLNDENIGRATTRHFIPPRIIAGAVRRSQPQAQDA
jgi:hypothetical protein